MFFSILQVGKTYGRKMATGYLRSKGLCVSEAIVARHLHALNPVGARERLNAVSRNLNPKPYIADYFGQKLHVDQNEKLVMYGVTHVLARDGFSGMIVAHSTMSIKNNLIIHEQIFR